MEYYLAVRMRRFGRAFPSGGSTGTGTTGERSNERSDRPMGAAVGDRPTSTGRVGGLGPTGQIGVTAVSTVRSVTRGTGRNPGRF